MDKELIKLCMTRNFLDELAPYVVEYAVTKRTWSIINYLKEYFKVNGTDSSVEAGSLIAFILTDANRIGENEFKLHKAAIESTATVKPSDVNLIKSYYAKIAAATEIYNKMNDIITNKTKDDIMVIRHAVDKYEEIVNSATDPSTIFVSGDITEVISKVTAPGLPWRLNELNISAGPIRRGDFIIVGAYVNTGKTTFAASEVSFMAQHLPEEKQVVWVNNEEDSDKVFFRILQATLGCTGHDVLKDPAAAMSKYESIMGNKNKILVLKNSRQFRKPEILESIFKKTNPGLIIFDTMDKIESHAYIKEERNRLGDVYSWARDIAHEYCPVIAVSQTSSQGETTQWIPQSMLRESKGDKPAEGDLILTIGLDPTDTSKAQERYINIAKNKLFGGTMSLESERHGKWVVTIDNERVRYVGTK